MVSVGGPTMAPDVPPEDTNPMGLEGVTVERKSFAPSASVIDKFLKMEAVPESAWLSAGMPLEVAALHRRVKMNEIYMLYGMVDIGGDLMTSLAAWAGHDRMAREDGKEVAGAMMRAMMSRRGERDEMRNNAQDVAGKTPNPG